MTMGIALAVPLLALLMRCPLGSALLPSASTAVIPSACLPAAAGVFGLAPIHGRVPLPSLATSGLSVIGAGDAADDDDDGLAIGDVIVVIRILTTRTSEVKVLPPMASVSQASE